jgi:hypothetical protein
MTTRNVRVVCVVPGRPQAATEVCRGLNVERGGASDFDFEVGEWKER